MGKELGEMLPYSDLCCHWGPGGGPARAGGRRAPETAARAGGAAARSLHIAEGAVVFHVPGTEMFSVQHTERNT